jgi:NAD(P)-dependent dehydrogenase (short-subunit alcohol dehydrogenase family)
LHTKGIVEFVRCDHSILADIVNLADIMKANFTNIDILYNNVGQVQVDNPWKTSDGLNATIMLNYLSHFLLTDQMYPMLNSTKGSRIV